MFTMIARPSGASRERLLGGGSKPASVAARDVRGGDGARDWRGLWMLLPIGEADARDTSVDGTKRVLRLLARALRSERRRGTAGHWTYSLQRHLALARLYREESARLRRMSRCQGSATPRPAR